MAMREVGMAVREVGHGGEGGGAMTTVVCDVNRLCDGKESECVNRFHIQI